MAKTTIPGGYIEAGSIDTASLADTSITADKLHTTLDLTGKTITVATATAGDNDTTVASTAFVSTAIANLAPLASPDFTGDATFDTDTLVIDSTNNNVGIGTSSPVGKTHIKNNNTYATSSQTSYDNASLRLDNLNTSSSIGTSFGIISPNVNYLQSGYNEGTTAPFALNPYGGNVGIGTSSPATTLDVVAGSTGGIRLKPTGQITNGYTGGLADFRQGLTFENAASSHAFSIGYGQGGHLRVSFHDGSSTFTELVEFKNSGTLNLSAGNLEIQPGYGIDFSGNANASGMSSELLDDYEEGTWTPAITGYSGTNPTVSMTSSGTYTKIGQFVTINVVMDSISVTGATGGLSLISGLPFTVNSTGSGSWVANGVTMARPNQSTPHALGTGLGFLSSNNGGGWAWENNGIYPSSGTGAMRITFTYFTT
jgi:hypothetical protein